MSIPILQRCGCVLLTQNGEFIAKGKMIDCTIVEVIPKEEKKHNMKRDYNVNLELVEFMGKEVNNYERK